MNDSLFWILLTFALIAVPVVFFKNKFKIIFGKIFSIEAENDSQVSKNTENITSSVVKVTGNKNKIDQSSSSNNKNTETLVEGDENDLTHKN